MVLNTGLIFSHSQNHNCPWDKKFPENANRISFILSRLNELNIIEKCKILEPQDLLESVIYSVHSKVLIENLKRISIQNDKVREEESSKYDSVYFSEVTWEAAKCSANAALTLVSEICSGNIENGMAIIRPPGHHAMHNEYNGYCFLNNVALAANCCLSNKDSKVNKILIFDFDIHHGQGIQDTFYESENVLYISIHRYDNGTFWPKLKRSNCNYIGKGAGRGFNINIPLNEHGLEDSDYLSIMFNIVLPVAYEFSPDIILVAAGYDSCIGDEKGEMLVTPQFYAHAISLLKPVVSGKIAVFLEGGYFEPSLADGVANTVSALLNHNCPKLYPFTEIPINKSVINTINNVKAALSPYWNCMNIQNVLKRQAGGDHKNMLTSIEYKGVPDKPPYATRNYYRVASAFQREMYSKFIDFLKDSTQNQPNKIKRINADENNYSSETLHMQLKNSTTYLANIADDFPMKVFCEKFIESISCERNMGQQYIIMKVEDEKIQVVLVSLGKPPEEFSINIPLAESTLIFLLVILPVCYSYAPDLISLHIQIQHLNQEKSIAVNHIIAMLKCLANGRLLILSRNDLPIYEGPSLPKLYSNVYPPARLLSINGDIVRLIKLFPILAVCS